MSDEFDDLRGSLKGSAENFRPALDPGQLAKAGRRHQQRRHTMVGLAGAGVLIVAAALIVPSLMPSPAVVPAIPAPVATSASPAPTAPSATPTTERPVDQKYSPIAPAVDTEGWTTFASREYPITFKYPAGWTIDTWIGKLDGCHSTNCVLTVTPPKGTRAAAIELIRNGFPGEDTTGGAWGQVSKPVVLGAVPDVTAWPAQTDGDASQLLVVSDPSRNGGHDLGLAAGGDLEQRVSVGDVNSWPDHPEGVFLFATNIGNIGGSNDKAGRDTVIAILASARTNPGFNPTQPSDNGAGEMVMKPFDSMAKPSLGTIRPNSTWKTLKVPAANVVVRYPPTWKATDQGDGVLRIKAPSGYVIAAATNVRSGACDNAPRSTWESVGEVTIKAGSRSFGSGPVEIRFEDAGEFAAWVGLAQHNAVKDCYQGILDFGGTKNLYLATADDIENPTVQELDEAVAILASATRLA
ncbi:MAG: hypothetical protein ACOH1Y_14250 [Propionicimonas sp.]